MTRRHKLLAAVAGCFAFYTIFGFLILPMVLTRMVPKRMAEQLNRAVNIEKIQVNPYALTVTVNNLDIKHTDGTNEFVSLKRLSANLEILSLFKRGLVVREVRLESPKLSVTRIEGGTFNFSDLMTSVETKAVEDKTKEEPSGPFLFAISDIAITNGEFVYKDQPFDKTHTISGINWRLPFISNFIKNRDRFSEPVLACNVDGATLSVDVKTKPFKDTLETQVDLSLTGIQIPHYTSYIPPDTVGFQVKKGVVSVGTKVSFRKEDGKTGVTVQGTLTLAELEVTDSKDRSILSLPKLSVEVLPSEVMEKRVHIGAVHIESPVISGVREADGVINLTQLIIPADSSSGADPDTPGNDTAEISAPADEPATTSPFVLNLDNFTLSDGVLNFSDAAAGSDSAPVETSVTDFDVSVTGFSNRPGTSSAFNTSVVINKSARVSLDGSFSADPVSVKTDVALSDFNLGWCQPYLPETVRLVITGGLASLSGTVDMALPADGPMSLTVTGKTGIKGFRTVDPEKAETFVKWSDFTLNGIHVSMVPLRVSVDEIVFKNLKNRLVIFEDGETSIAKIFVKKEEAKQTDTPKLSSETKKPEKIVPVRIGKVQMTNTGLGFIDRSISPRYSTSLTLNDLLVTGLTSEDFKAATVKAAGAIDGYAPVHITGTINPLAQDLFVDLDLKFSNIEMVPFSSYTGKYIGQAIEKGKLSLGVKYHIKNKAINADNHLFLDQFTLGKSVKSPDAVNLPVGLAIALLQDRNGHIDVNMPISGRTDDPDFRWGGLAIKALTNLITKAATSPFALVGSLVGGGEELRFIEFKPGFALLDDPNQEKLTTLKALLTERPGLRLEIVGYADPESDRDALTGLALERKIKAPEILEAVKQGNQPTPETVAAITIPPEAREKALKKLYKTEILENPPQGFEPKSLNDKTLTLDEIESTLKQTITISDTELRILATGRANTVKTALLSDGSIRPERVFLKKADTLSPEDPAGFKTSRVEIGVK